MTLETGLRRLFWIDNRTSSAASFDMQTPRAVTRFAAHVHRLLWRFAALCTGLAHDDLFCLQSRVRCRSEVTHDLFVTRRAFLRSNKFRAGNAGRGENCSARRTAGKQNYGERDCAAGAPQERFAPTVDPST